MGRVTGTDSRAFSLYVCMKIVLIGPFRGSAGAKFLIMKNGMIMACALLCAGFLVTSCGSKQMVQSPKNANPFAGGSYAPPCTVFDDNENFAATGMYLGSSRQMGECQLNALENAKQMIYAKYHHSYNGMISNYSSTFGTNKGNDIKTKLERAGDATVKAVLNDAQACCLEFGPVQDDGMVYCYIAIRIPKDELAEKTAKEIADVLTPEEKEEINFDEFQYRERMKNAFNNQEGQ